MIAVPTQMPPPSRVHALDRPTIISPWMMLLSTLPHPYVVLDATRVWGRASHLPGGVTRGHRLLLWYGQLLALLLLLVRRPRLRRRRWWQRWQWRRWRWWWCLYLLSLLRLLAWLLLLLRLLLVLLRWLLLRRLLLGLLPHPLYFFTLLFIVPLYHLLLFLHRIPLFRLYFLPNVLRIPAI